MKAVKLTLSFNMSSIAFLRLLRLVHWVFRLVRLYGLFVGGKDNEFWKYTKEKIEKKRGLHLRLMGIVYFCSRKNKRMDMTREGWAAAAKQAHADGEDKLIIDEVFADETLVNWQW